MHVYFNLCFIHEYVNEGIITMDRGERANGKRYVFLSAGESKCRCTSENKEFYCYIMVFDLMPAFFNLFDFIFE
jgi:hypothetical protein